MPAAMTARVARRARAATSRKVRRVAPSTTPSASPNRAAAHWARAGMDRAPSSRLRELDRELAQPPVVGLARHRPVERVDGEELLRPLVPGQVVTGMVAEGVVDGGAVGHLEERGHHLAHRGSGTPTTAASTTAGCERRTCSTSSGYTFSPPVLMHAEPRPSSSML